MRNRYTLIMVSAMMLASLAVSPLAQAHEIQAGDDRLIPPPSFRLGDDDLVSHNRGEGQVELRHGADDPAGDDRGGQLEARHGADDPAGDDRGRRGGGNDDPTPHF
jgi:hypothetical protein